MKKPLSKFSESSFINILNPLFYLFFIFWTVLVLALALWNFQSIKSMQENIALTAARHSIGKDLTYRRWATNHGGVYVPVSDRIRPSPYLSDVPERDVTTPSGRILTLINPAWMTRQVHETADDGFGIRGHITSLKTLRPGNAPDDWEKSALLAFQKGETEVWTIAPVDGENHLRLIRAMTTEQGCLKCHSGQGYKVGDIRGGISVSLPWEPYEATLLAHRRNLLFGYGGIWAVGLLGLFSSRFYFLHLVTRRKEYERQLEYQATHDNLTGLANRALLVDRLQQSLQFAERSQRIVAVLLLDLERFKIVNDSLGHSQGDELLREVALRLNGCVRQCDTVARLGGDEFVVIFAEVAEIDDIGHLAKEIIATLGVPYKLEDGEIHLTASIGISTFPRDSQVPEILIRNADIAMYRTKDEGGNNFTFFAPEMNVRARERLELDGDLRKALAQKEFLLHYQPKVDIASGRIIGCEALVRWQHPTRGLIVPNMFIPLAEETGLIVKIDSWVLGEACEQIQEWLKEGLAPVKVAVNMSAKHFIQSDLVHQIRETLARYTVDPRLLELEITESTIMANPTRAAETMQRLKEIGFSLYLDDFGTGYSSLNYLRRFPVDGLKIDRSFVHKVAVDAGDAALTSSIVAIARNLGIATVAEGVETWEQFDFLAACRCNALQGYLFSKPVPAEEFTAMLRKNLTLTRNK
jgi:diguanylate cyclase (GGDEF)-like protein